MIVGQTRDRDSSVRSGDRHELWWLATGGPTANPSSGNSVVKLIYKSYMLIQPKLMILCLQSDIL
jgi:hypothetical protein